MKKIAAPFIIILSLLVLAGCSGKGSTKKSPQTATDTVSVPDTGFTGISKGMSGRYIVNEITYKNGVRQGLMKTFYMSGKLRQTFWYEKGLRQDSSRWYFEEGQLFRTTPYKNDTIDGIQKQYFRTGQLKDEIGYKKGLRTTYFKEYSKDGKLVTGYPKLDVQTKDNYKTNGTFIVTLKLSDNSTKVKFFRGDISSEVFDSAHCKRINAIKGVGSLVLKKTGKPQSQSLGVIAEVLTLYGNNLLIFKKIDLPYSDLN